jgi:diguanylate cyclase (GGDEF)-like protein
VIVYRNPDRRLVAKQYLEAILLDSMTIGRNDPLTRRFHWAWRALLVVLFASLAESVASANDELIHRALGIEAALYGYPQTGLLDLEALVPRADVAPKDVRIFVYSLYGQAMVQAGKPPAAAELADRLEAEATKEQDLPGLATARLIRSAIESSAGAAAKSSLLAREARTLLKGSDDAFMQYWAALALGTSARTLGQSEEALAALHDALSYAERASNAYRRSSALYQLSVLYLALKQGRESLAASLAAYEDAKAAKSVYAMANAKMGESAAMELLQQPARELAAMQEALAIARNAHSRVAEGRALVNLADIHLRRKQFGEALDAARQALALAQATSDGRLAAASKANMGFSLLGLGHIAEGKRLTDEAVADYERSGATADIVDLIDEYGRDLERLGDYQGALALYHRDKTLTEEIAQATQTRALVELQEKYESEKRIHEISLLNRENQLKTAELANRELEQRVWWSLAALFALSFIVVAVLYRKLRATNRLLAQKNAELGIQSTRDPLTGLYNRRYFQNFITDEHDGSRRRRRDDDRMVRALLLIDIDHFKETNDRFGHALGDAVLVAVARKLRDSLRETDMIVRWGGEEFLVLATTNIDRMDELAARILHGISAAPIMVLDKVIRTTASIGYIPIPLPPSDVPLPWDSAIGLVDMALYMAKVNGRNRAYGIRRLARGDSETLAATERDLEHASKEGLVEMRVVYGPHVASATQVESQSSSDSPVPSAVPLRAAKGG